MKRFYLIREEDFSGVSGVGCVAEGVMFGDGRCVMRWRTRTSSTALYDSLSDLIAIHGHGGTSRVVIEGEDEIEMNEQYVGG